jgi:hypothetical protein
LVNRTLTSRIALVPPVTLKDCTNENEEPNGTDAALLYHAAKAASTLSVSGTCVVLLPFFTSNVKSTDVTLREDEYPII